MAEALTQVDSRTLRRLALYGRIHGPECADKYRAIGEWWRIHAEESAAKAACYHYANAQDLLAEDMDERPQHYRSRPEGRTAWGWSGIPDRICVLPKQGGGR